MNRRRRLLEMWKGAPRTSFLSKQSTFNSPQIFCSQKKFTQDTSFQNEYSHSTKYLKKKHCVKNIQKRSEVWANPEKLGTFLLGIFYLVVVYWESLQLKPNIQTLEPTTESKN